MDFGAHLPIIGLDDRPFSLERLMAYAEHADRCGFSAIAANDHLAYARPWLDGLTALAAVLARVGSRVALMTTVALPVVRGPLPLAKALAALDVLSGGRLIAGIGPGSSPRDYALAGVPFDERWKRLEEALPVLRGILQGTDGTFKGNYYSLEGGPIEPLAAQQPGPPLWIGSWGSEVGLRRTARLADGWLASAYNTTPSDFADAWARLRDHLVDVGREAEGFPNALATMFFHIAEDRNEADTVLREVLRPLLNRPEEELRQKLLVGSVEECAEKLRAYGEAGVQRVLLWPVGDEIPQLEVFCEKVVPLVNA